MSSDRSEQYDGVKKRFVDDPDFRAQFRADPAKALENHLGELTEEERRWVSAIPGSMIPNEEQIEWLRRGPMGAW